MAIENRTTLHDSTNPGSRRIVLYKNNKRPGIVARQGPSVLFIDAPIADDFAAAFADLLDDLPPRLGKQAAFPSPIAEAGA